MQIKRNVSRQHSGSKNGAANNSPLTREEMVVLLNEDLEREYQAIIAYVVYSQVIDGAAYKAIAEDLAVHAAEELQHALMLSKQVVYLGGMPTVIPKPVKTSSNAQEMLHLDLENERVTINHYRERICQAESMGEYALSETLRKIIQQEQDHEIDLASALGIQAPTH